MLSGERGFVPPNKPSSVKPPMLHPDWKTNPQRKIHGTLVTTS